MDLYMLARRSGYARLSLAELLGVTPATLDRYLDTNRAPAAVARLLEVLAGRMPWSGFEAFTVCRGVIYYRDNPDGLPAEEIPAYHMRLKLLAILERDLERYRRAPAQYYFDFIAP